MDFLKFMDKSPTAYQAVDTIKTDLEENGFEKICRKDVWDLKAGGKYFFTVNDACVMAFTVGDDPKSFRIINSHGDSPTFRIKPTPNFDNDNYQRLGVDIHGGPILSTWLDRPLSVAGRVFTKTSDPYKPKFHLVNIDKDLLTIPNAAIHLHDNINKGYEYKPQVDLLPLLGLKDSKSFLEIIAEEIGESVEDILDFDLYLYAREKACYLGADEEFISSGRLDNLAMAYASYTALVNEESSDVNVCFVAGNEEIGSMGIEGADTPLLSDTLRRIATSLGLDFDRMCANSFVVSADMAHAIHPNLPELSDRENHIVLNGGPAIKYSGNKNYITDAYSASVFKFLAEKAGVKVQTYTNRADQRGGRTIGPLNTNHMNIPIVDVGNPTLAMHSVREVCGRKDMEDMVKVFREFYKNF